MTFNRTGLGLAILLSIVPTAAFPQQANAPAVPVIERDAQGHVTIRATRLTEPIVLDGRLDEDIYRQTEAISGFIEQEPFEGQPATEKTEVWVAYDNDAIYIGARLWETDPAKRVMSDMRRDAGNLYNNDHFAVMLDTFNDRRNGYVFYANAQGGMVDARIANENAESDFNTIWQTRAADFDGGWTIEFRIPFRSIRFREGSRVWGINFRRMVRWKTETSFLAPVPASFGQSALNKSSFAATLIGIEAPPRVQNLDVKGYALGSAITNRSVRPAIENDGDGEVGVDVKWLPSQSYVVDFTYNTDFAQVEDDEQQVNLTRFSLQYPEKREFFLEGAQFFGFGTMTGSASMNPEVPMIFFSRRVGIENGGVVPIVGGGRLLGRSGPNQIGVLHMRTGDVPALRAVATDFSAVRMQREVLRRSRIGMIATRRAPSVGGHENYGYGADAAFVWFDNVQFTNYLAQTKTAGRNGNDLSYRSRFNWNSDRWGIDTEQLGAGEDFNPEMGFIRRPEGFRRTHGFFRFSPRPARWRSIRKVYYQANVEYFTDARSDHVTTREQQAQFRVDFTSGDQARVEINRTYEAVDEAFVAAKGVRIPVGGYNAQDVVASYTFGPQHRVSGSATARHGSFFDGTITEIGWRGRLEFSPQLYAEPTVSWNVVDTPWGRGSANLASSRITYTLSPRMFVSGLVQYQGRTDSLSTNARFRWEYRPGSELFVVYSDGRNTLTRGIPDLQNRSFVVKLTRLFQF